ncbi:MAG: peptide chain release factor 2 [Bacteriovoracaceae bacterium]
MSLHECRNKMAGLKEKVDLIRRALDLDKKIARLKDIESLEAKDGFWQDTENASKIQKEKSIIADIIGNQNSIKKDIEEFEILVEFAENDNSEADAVAAVELFATLEQKIITAEEKSLLKDEVDPNNAIITINSGAGGTESCDWASMLYRMIIKWAEKKGFKLKLMDQQPGETAGIKSVAFVVEGPYAFGLLKSESGIHRLVRISPFDSNARRHTSFASIFVSPELDDNIEIEVLDKDIKIDVYRSGGAGGQSVNTTDSAVRITHFPTGIVVTCQNERSQLQNKLFAMKILKSRLYEKAMQEKRAKLDAIENNKKENAWGSQIRSYVLHPYKLVKDHRNNFESYQAEKVLEGDLDGFMKAYLQWYVLGKNEESKTELDI